MKEMTKKETEARELELKIVGKTFLLQ